MTNKIIFPDIIFPDAEGGEVGQILVWGRDEFGNPFQAWRWPSEVVGAGSLSLNGKEDD